MSDSNITYTGPVPPGFHIGTYVNGEYVEMVWDDKRKAFVVPESAE